MLKVINHIQKLTIRYTQELETLKEYCKASNEIINNKINDAKNKYKYGLKADGIISELFSCKTQEEVDAKIQDINCRDFYGMLFSKAYPELEYDLEQEAASYNINVKWINKPEYIPSESKGEFVNTCRLRNMYRLSFLSNLITIFENYINLIYLLLFAKNPSVYFGDTSISIQELLHKKKEDLIYQKMEEVVDKNMYDACAVLSLIEEKEHIVLEDNNSIKECYIELNERRNAFVHTDGTVNQKYMSKTKRKDVKVGDSLDFDENYVVSSIDSIEQYIFSISLSLINKYNMNSEDKELSQLFEYYYKRLRNEDYRFLAPIYKKLSSSRCLDYSDKTIAYVNLLICLKEMSDPCFSELISSFDVSAMEDKFKIAKYVLLDDFKNAYDLIEESYEAPADTIALYHWPLYKHFRESPFYQLLVDKHQEDFSKISFSTDNCN